MSEFLLNNFNGSLSQGAVNRLGVIDIGSNSVRLVVFDGAARSPAYFYNEKVICTLGSDLSSKNELNVTNKSKALSAVKRFVTLAKLMKSSLVAVATAAIRNTEDGKAFCKEIFKETGLEVIIISGNEEAKLSAQGVLLGWPEADGLVCDLGGSSLELAEVSKCGVGEAISCPIGPLNLGHDCGNRNLQGDIVKSELKRVRNLFSKQYNNIYLVGGSWRSIARIHMELTNYPLKVLHEYQISIPEINKTIIWCQQATLSDLKTVSSSSTKRLRLLPVSALILAELIRYFQPKKIAISSYGLREGLLYGAMDANLRRQDPLLEACRYMEYSAARIPGFGDTLFNFISPLFENGDRRLSRLIKAACYLHDVSWREHPDYRADVCFDSAMRANLGGIDHGERAFLAIALVYRYKNPKNIGSFSDILSILNKTDRRNAEILGKAMRFGAMLSGSAAESMGKLHLDKNKKVLKLIISEEHTALFGEVVKQRFSSLADKIKYEPVTELT